MIPLGRKWAIERDKIHAPGWTTTRFCRLGLGRAGVSWVIVVCVEKEAE